MKNSSKAGILIIGIFIGLICGIALAAWMDYKGWEINPLHQFSNLDFFRNDKTEDYNDQYHSSVSNRDSNTRSLMSKKGSEEYNNNVSNDSPDSISTNNHISSERPLKVSTDQLLYSKQIKISAKPGKENNELDSLLIDDKYTTDDNNIITVEFWQSPINYVGYKWANNKLVLFGFYDFTATKIIACDDNYYMNYGTLYYLLENTNTFRNLSLVNDPAIIKKLNSL